MKFFYNNLGINAVIIYFCFVLIDLINDYKNHKNIYSRNNVCLRVCRMVFMSINTFKNYCQYKGWICGYLGDGIKCVRFVCVLFESI